MEIVRMIEDGNAVFLTSEWTWVKFKSGHCEELEYGGTYRVGQKYEPKIRSPPSGV